MAANTSAQRFDRVVSLGYSCQTAHQIRRMTGDETAYPFDWVVTTNAGLVSDLSNDLAGFFDLDLLHRPTADSSVTHVNTLTEFPHEFPANGDMSVAHAENEGRYRALAQRWADLMDGTDALLFVREDRSRDEPPSAGERLRDALDARMPHRRFHVLYLTNRTGDKTDWGIDGITNGYLWQLDPYEWEGGDRQWTDLLADFDIPRARTQ